jgi:hypothetical protein
VNLLVSSLASQPTGGLIARNMGILSRSLWEPAREER